MEMPPYGSRGKLLPQPSQRTFPRFPQGLENAPQTPARVSHIPTATTTSFKCELKKKSREEETRGSSKLVFTKVVKVGVHCQWGGGVK